MPVRVEVYDACSTCVWDVNPQFVGTLISLLISRYRRVSLTARGGELAVMVVSGRRCLTGETD